MQVLRFNRSINSKKPKAKGAPTQLPPPPRPVQNFDSLDAGFDDIGIGKADVVVAPGLVAHFGCLGSPADLLWQSGYQTTGYHEVPLLERIGEA